MSRERDSRKAGFGARLAEERKRLGLKQAEFAVLAGTDMPKQSLYENDHRALRAAYLARAATTGVDPLYVLTGQRSGGEPFEEDVTGLLSAYFSLPQEMRAILARFAGDLSRACEQGSSGEPAGRG